MKLAYESLAVEVSLSSFWGLNLEFLGGFLPFVYLLVNH